MFPLKRQYFFLYHLAGCLYPFIAVYFREEAGFTQSQVSYAMALTFGALMVSPVVATFLADTRLDSRRIVACLYAASALALLTLGGVALLPVVLLCWAAHSLGFAAQIPMHDGLYFSVTRKKETTGEPQTPYHRIRVWGTVGFIVPSFAIYLLIREGATIAIILPVAIASCLMGVLNSFTVPDPRLGSGKGPPARAPTRAAAKVLFQPRMLPFCAGIALGHLGGATFFAFYPVYLREAVGISPEWLGLIFNIGVALEFFFMLTFGWFLRKMGARLIIAAGLAASSLRMGLLAFFPTVEMAVFTQLFHGPYILAMQVAPVLLLNRLAGDAFRNSIQGLYNMTLHGFSRILGALLAGQLAAVSLPLTFLVAASLMVLAALVVLVLFRSPVASFREQ